MGGWVEKVPPGFMDRQMDAGVSGLWASSADSAASTLSSVFQSFFEGQSAPWDSAKKDENRMKNRYGNIIACRW